MGKSVPALIHPDLLVWARKTAGFSQEEAAEKLGVSAPVYAGWELGEQMSFAKLREAAKCFRRPLAAFFLDSPPADLPPLKDFRKAQGVAAAKNSPELLADIRLARSRRSTALRLSPEIGFPVPHFELGASREEDPEAVGSRLRAALGVPHASARTWPSLTVALEIWRQSLEEKGVLVFKAKHLNKEEARGFSISDHPLPVIVIASGDAQAGQIFTLMHEFTHLVLRAGGVCDLADSDDVERFCNHVAGAILVPATELLADEEIVAAPKTSEWGDDTLSGLAKSFSVSEEVILRRLLILKKTTREFYVRKRSEYLQRYASHKPFGRAEYDVKSVRSLGHLYAQIVLDAYHREAITLADVSDYFDVKLKWIPGIERQLFTPPSPKA